MFNFVSSLAKAAVGVVVDTPLSLVADVVTLGGAITDAPQPYTATALENVAKNVGNAVNPNK